MLESLGQRGTLELIRKLKDKRLRDEIIALANIVLWKDVDCISPANVRLWSRLFRNSKKLCMSGEGAIVNIDPNIDEMVEALQTFPNLETLELDHFILRPSYKMAQIVKIPSLRKLKIEVSTFDGGLSTLFQIHDFIGKNGAVTRLPYCAKLTSLELIHVYLTHDTDLNTFTAGLANALPLCDLNYLDLSGSVQLFRGRMDLIYSALPQCRNLQTLKIRHTLDSDRVLLLTPILRNCRHLHTLDLRGNILGKVHDALVDDYVDDSRGVLALLDQLELCPSLQLVILSEDLFDDPEINDLVNRKILAIKQKTNIKIERVPIVSIIRRFRN
jgi:hypothetical protein